VLGTASLNASGQASFSTTMLNAGTHVITAGYAGDSNFGSSTSPVVNQTVTSGQTGGQASAITLSSAPNPSTAGQPVPFNAAVTSTAQGSSATSSFAPPAENPLSEGGKWVTPVNPLTTVAIQKDSTNTISPSVGQGGAVARYVGQTYSANQFAQATIVSRSGS